MFLSLPLRMCARRRGLWRWFDIGSPPGAKAPICCTEDGTAKAVPFPRSGFILRDCERYFFL